MKIEDMKVGQKVRCLHHSKIFKGKLGTISSVLVASYGGRDGHITITWDDGSNDLGGWSRGECFEPLDIQPLQPKPIQSHICKCGIFRGDCDYHKD